MPSKAEAVTALVCEFVKEIGHGAVFTTDDVADFLLESGLEGKLKGALLVAALKAAGCIDIGNHGWMKN